MNRMQVMVQVPATAANLGAGFDCLGLALDIHNQFEFTLGREGFIARGEGASFLNRERGRLVRQAWNAAFKAAGRRPEPVEIRARTAIPLGGGLGSSATAIVAGLLAANYLGRLNMSRESLLQLASSLEGHPDNVAAALFGGLTVSTLSSTQQQPGESGVVCVPVGIAPDLTAVVAIPEMQIKTSQAREVLPAVVSREDAVFNLARSSLFVAAWVRRKWDLLGEAMEDRLHQSFRAKLVPGLLPTIDAARRAGALGAAFSGSGPSIIALVVDSPDDPDVASQVGRAMEKSLASEGVQSQIVVTRPSGQGARLVFPRE